MLLFDAFCVEISARLQPLEQSKKVRLSCHESMSPHHEPMESIRTHFRAHECIDRSISTPKYIQVFPLKQDGERCGLYKTRFCIWLVLFILSSTFRTILNFDLKGDRFCGGFVVGMRSVGGFNILQRGIVLKCGVEEGCVRLNLHTHTPFLAEARCNHAKERQRGVMRALL